MKKSNKRKLSKICKIAEKLMDGINDLDDYIDYPNSAICILSACTWHTQKISPEPDFELIRKCKENLQLRTR